MTETARRHQHAAADPSRRRRPAPRVRHRATVVRRPLARDSSRRSAPSSPGCGDAPGGDGPAVRLEMLRVGYADGGSETYLLTTTYSELEIDGHENALVGPVPGRGRWRPALRLRRRSRAGGRVAADPADRDRHVRRRDDRAPGRGDRRHRSPAGPLRRAVEHLDRVRQRPAQAVPPDPAGPQPRRHRPRGLRPRRAHGGAGAARLGRRAPGPTPTASTPATWRWPPGSCPRPPTAGRRPRPACATCSPRATCTPTRSAATWPPRCTGWVRPPG